MNYKFELRLTREHLKAIAWCCKASPKTEEEIKELADSFIRICVAEQLNALEIQEIANCIKEAWKKAMKDDR